MWLCVFLFVFSWLYDLLFVGGVVVEPVDEAVLLLPVDAEVVEPVRGAHGFGNGSVFSRPC